VASAAELVLAIAEPVPITKLILAAVLAAVVKLLEPMVAVTADAVEA
jgi:hypothetical protein